MTNGGGSGSPRAGEGVAIEARGWSGCAVAEASEATVALAFEMDVRVGLSEETVHSEDDAGGAGDDLLEVA